MNAQIEIKTVGTVVNLIFGIFDQANNIWDWLKCGVPYDGDVNTIVRYYTASDRYSDGPDTPNQIGVSDEAMKLDRRQDWKLDEENSKSTCPYLQKCVF